MAERTTSPAAPAAAAAAAAPASRSRSRSLRPASRTVHGVRYHWHRHVREVDYGYQDRIRNIICGVEERALSMEVALRQSNLALVREEVKALNEDLQRLHEQR